MGLGAPKNRTKLSHDPNNTTWSRSSSNYGHKILAQQGWKPGDYLGAENADHASHYTAASASHIRILLREDGLGLGAKVGGGAKAETFGLSLFSGILGRLNGKSDVEVRKQQDQQRDVELANYQARKHGFMNFVRGGLLVGDRIEEIGEDNKAGPVTETAQPLAKSKKRKAGDDAETDAAQKILKRKKRRSDLRARVDSVEPSPTQTSADEQGPRKKSRQSRFAEATDATTASPGPATPAQEEESARSAQSTNPVVAEDKQGTQRSTSTFPTKARKLQKKPKPSKPFFNPESATNEKARLKLERRHLKEQRRAHKAEKPRAHSKNAASIGDKPAETQRYAPGTPLEAIAEEVSIESTGTSTPVGGRHAVRQRYIQQKRLANLNPQALREIFMMKG